jgi:hypothetical protein
MHDNILHQKLSSGHTCIKKSELATRNFKQHSVVAIRKHARNVNYLLR